MNIHEYQAKMILKEFGIPVSDFVVISSIAELDGALEDLGVSENVVLKVQVHAGGRGKAGGVKIAKTRKEIEQYAGELLKMKIVNSQTGSHGVIANEILLTPLVGIKKEYYMGIVIDRQKAQSMLIASPEGGMDIEEIAHKFPEKVKTFPIGIDGKIRSHHLSALTKFMGWSGRMAQQGKKLALSLAEVFVLTDASLVEINPLVETDAGDLLALDAKISVDENALFRQEQIAAFYDPSQLSPIEAQARSFDLAYVGLDGSIGCMVNGAGLAMATMDIIHHYGGTPANFLDVGGGASKEKVAEGFKIILADPNVKSIFVNIFGGIMNCVTLAAGIISAASELSVKVPLIVRMEGTNVVQGKKMLLDSELNIIVSDNLSEAAQKAVKAATDQREEL